MTPERFEAISKNIIENKYCTNCRWYNYIPRKCNYNPTFDKDFKEMDLPVDGTCIKWVERGEALFRSI